jgi:hypothetical protein
MLKPLKAEDLRNDLHVARVEIANDAVPIQTELSGMHIECSHFYDLWMRISTVKESQIKYSLLERVNLRDATLQQVDFTGTTFVECDLSQATLSGCGLWYTRFERCRLNYESLLNNLPREDNLKTQVLRSLRLNAANEGDVRQANRLLLYELDSERADLYNRFMHTSPYYKERYKDLERAKACVSWIAHWVQRIGWGYGLRLRNLSFSISSIILVTSCLLTISGALYSVGVNDPPRTLNFLESLYVTVITFCTVGFGDITPASNLGRTISGATAILGVISWGFFVAAVYRRLAK